MAIIRGDKINFSRRFLGRYYAKRNIIRNLWVVISNFENGFLAGPLLGNLIDRIGASSANSPSIVPRLLRYDIISMIRIIEFYGGIDSKGNMEDSYALARENARIRRQIMRYGTSLLYSFFPNLGRFLLSYVLFETRSRRFFNLTNSITTDLLI